MIAQITMTTTTLTAPSTDSREYWVTRHGQPMKRRWNELTATEQRQQREAEERQAYVAMFAIY